MIRLYKLTDHSIEGLYQTTREATCLSYSPSGNFLAAGLRKGEVMIYQSHSPSFKLRLKYRLKCRNRYGLKSNGRNVTGLEFMDEEYLLVTTNDSRIRLFKFKENQLVQKYRGNVNTKLEIRACFSPHKSHIICGSEGGDFFI